MDDLFTERSDDLNDWEGRFILDINIKLMSGFQLTQAQEEKLEQIYADKTY